MDRLDQYRVFVRVADMGSFVRAANAMELPRASVSAAVQRLEEQLGTRLLHRTTRQVSLTPDGQQLRERLRQLLADAEDVEQLFNASQRRAAGRLHVDVPSRVARRLIAPALPELLRRHPQLALTLGSSDRSINLVQDGVDCVIRVGTLADSSLAAKPLGAVAIVNCASPAYLRAHGAPAHPADLERHFAVGYASAITGRETPWEYVDEQGAPCRISLRSRVLVNNVETYLACCRAGLGLIQVPRYDVQDLLLRKELVEVLPQWQAVPMEVAALYPHRRQRSRRLAVFIEWLQTLLEPHLLRQP